MDHQNLFNRRSFIISGAAACSGMVLSTVRASSTGDAIREGDSMTELITRDSKGYLQVPARTIPIPDTISKEAQKLLAAPMIPGMPFREPPHGDKAAWKRYVSEMTDKFSRMSGALPPFAGKIESRNVGSARLYELTPDTIPAHKQDWAILLVHGGGFVMGGGELATKVSLPAVAQIKTYSIDYRMPPDHPYPAALDDVVAAYRYILTRHKPNKVAVKGSSAGGGLAAAAILKLRDLGLPLPGAAVLHTPEADLTQSGDTFETNQHIDSSLGQRLTESVLLYANGHDLHDPYLSPVLGDFSRGFPPTLLISGTRDLFLSNTVRLHRALRKAGIEADLHVFEAMPHGGFFGAPEDAEVMDEQRQFIDRVLGRA